jgi:acyl-CoA synthetase (AMP-forming)/AMP-acid ligase II
MSRWCALGAELPWAHSYRTLAQSRASLPRARASDLVYLIYTSGTSGRPKGAMLNQKGQLEFGRVIAEETAVTGRDRMLIVMPLYHVGAKCNQLAALYRGCPLVVMRNYSALDVASAIESHAVTVAHLAPLMVAELVALAKNQSFNRGTLRLVQYASGPMPVAQLREAVGTYGQIFMQMYGMTEAGVITVLYPEQHILEGDPDVVRRLGSAGVSPPSAKVKVVDDNGRECPVGVQGEVVAFTPSLLRGYWNSTVATHDALSDGWLKTGDIGWLDSSGFLFIVDRKKDVIISGGENIYPREVEEALHFHPAVEAVAVIGVPDEKWGEAVKAFVVTTKTKSTTEAELIEFCKTKLASYKKPKSVQFVDRLPRLANQKIDRKALREPFWRGRSSRV